MKVIVMPRLKRYRIFFSHAWDFDEHAKIEAFLRTTSNFIFTDLSVPHDNPVEARGKKDLSTKLTNLIRLSQVVLISAGMEVNYRPWIDFELNVAQDMNKPIVGIVPLGQTRIPAKVEDAACDIVRWRRKSIADSVRYYAI